jgi:hypothetical protein
LEVLEDKGMKWFEWVLTLPHLPAFPFVKPRTRAASARSLYDSVIYHRSSVIKPGRYSRCLRRYTAAAFGPNSDGK